MLKTRENRALLVAMAIGDGQLKLDMRYPGSRTATLRVSHKFAHLEYVKYKASLVQDIIGSPVRVVPYDNHGYPAARFDKGHRYFKILRGFLYSGNVKVLRPHVLRWLTKQAVAIWYMDDGNLTLHRRNGKVHSREIYLNTYCPLEEAIVVRDYFSSVWGIQFRIAKHKGRYRLACNTTQTKRFLSLFGPYVVSCMKYKTDMAYSTAPDTQTG